MPDAATYMPSAVAAFDAVADRFDARFGEWASVAAQRRAVRRYLLDTFSRGTNLLELAGGTAEDALFMAAAARNVLLTDGSPTMVEHARRKAAAAGLRDRIDARVLVLEEIESFARDFRLDGGAAFDGVYSNFAGLNCVADLRPVARGLARVLMPGASAVLVLFGPLPPGEVLVQVVRGDARAAFRRLQRTDAPARIGAHEFAVHYPTPSAVAASFAPWFRMKRKRGIGVFVPPSAAEPFASKFPRTLRVLEQLDRAVAAPLALLGDHVLLHFVRTDAYLA